MPIGLVVDRARVEIVRDLVTSHGAHHATRGCCDQCAGASLDADSGTRRHSKPNACEAADGPSTEMDGFRFRGGLVATVLMSLDAKSGIGGIVGGECDAADPERRAGSQSGSEHRRIHGWIERGRGEKRAVGLTRCDLIVDRADELWRMKLAAIGYKRLESLAATSHLAIQLLRGRHLADEHFDFATGAKYICVVGGRLTADWKTKPVVEAMPRVRRIFDHTFGRKKR